MIDKKNKSVGIVIQARLGSTRLPGKVLMPFGDTTLLGWIIRKVKVLPYSLVVATSNKEEDDNIEEYCAKLGINCFRGSEHDVLDRYYKCAREFSFNSIVRLTADNPFVDIEELQDLVKKHMKSDAHYTHNLGELPVGVGCEVFSIEALEESWVKGKKTHHREHVNEYILENKLFFNIVKKEISSAKKAPELILTIDTQEEYENMLKLVNIAQNTNINTKDLITICSSFV